MCSTPFPAGICSDSLPQQLDLSKDIAMEDCDLLFDAVIARLQSSCDDKPLTNGTSRHMAWVQTRARVMECVQALDQLHLAATHELARQRPAATEGLPQTTGLQVSAMAADLSMLPDDVMGAIWTAWQEHLRACAGLSVPSGRNTRPAG